MSMCSLTNCGGTYEVLDVWDSGGNAVLEHQRCDRCGHLRDVRMSRTAAPSLSTPEPTPTPSRADNAPQPAIEGALVRAARAVIAHMDATRLELGDMGTACWGYGPSGVPWSTIEADLRAALDPTTPGDNTNTADQQDPAPSPESNQTPEP